MFRTYAKIQGRLYIEKEASPLLHSNISSLLMIAILRNSLVLERAVQKPLQLSAALPALVVAFSMKPHLYEFFMIILKMDQHVSSVAFIW